MSSPGAGGDAIPTEAEAPRKTKQAKIATEERKRAVRACAQCRRLKEKCEGGIPCRRCTHYRRPCVFETITSPVHDSGHSDRNSRASNAYTRDVHDRLVYMQRILRHNFKGISLDTASLRRMAEAITEEGASPDPEEVDDLIIEEEVCTIDPIEDTITHYSGEFSYWNFSMRIKRQIEDRMMGLDDQVTDQWRAEQLQSGSSNLSTALLSCPPRQIADFLVRIFFDFAATHYFYVEKSWLLERLNLLYDDPAKLDIKGAATLSIILTVFAIGTQYAYLDSPNQSQKVNVTPEFSEDELGNMFYQRAIRLLPEIIESSSLESVQACLLFAVYELPIDASGLGYSYVNLAIRLAMQNGMHRKYTGSALTPVMIETRNRVWWSAYALERKICIFHGRPLSMLRSDIDSDLPKDHEDMRRGDSSWNCSYMNASMHLTYNLEDYLFALSLLRNCRKQEVPSILLRLMAIKNTLAKWWDTFADDVHNNDQSQHPVHFRTVAHLRLEYCLVRMFVGRPFLFGRQSSQSNFNSPAESCENQATRSNKRVSPRSTLVDDCIQAAKDALETLGTLRDTETGLARSSYMEYSSCRVSLLVLIAHSIQSQSDQFQRPLQDGLDMIREMSTTGDSARSEVSLIEALERALARLRISNSPSNGDDDAKSAPETLASGYDHFKHWESMWKSGAVDTSQHGPGAVAVHPTVAQPQLIDYDPYTWSAETRNQGSTPDNIFTMPSNSINSATFSPFHPTSDLAFFGEGNMPLLSHGPSRHEAHVLEGFLANSGHPFDLGVGHGTASASVGSPPRRLPTGYGMFPG